VLNIHYTLNLGITSFREATGISIFFLKAPFSFEKLAWQKMELEISFLSKIIPHLLAVGFPYQP